MCKPSFKALDKVAKDVSEESLARLPYPEGCDICSILYWRRLRPASASDTKQLMRLNDSGLLAMAIDTTNM